MTSPWTAPGQPEPRPARDSGPGADGAGVQRELVARSTLFPLRPMGVGEILGAGAAIFRHRRGTVLGTTAAVLGIGFFLDGLLSGASIIPTVMVSSSMTGTEASLSTLPGMDPASLLSQIGTWVLSALVSLVCGQLVALFLVRIAVDQVRGEELSAAQLRGLMLRRGPRAVAVALLEAVLALLPPVLLGTIGALPFIIRQDASIWFAFAPLLGVLLGTLVSAWIMTRLVMAVPVIAVENLGVMGALRRAITLSRGRTTWRLLGIGALVTLLTFCATQAIAGVFGLIAVPVMVLILLATQGGSVTAAVVVVTVLSLFGGYLASIFVTPFSHGALAATYADTRMRLEGWDAELLAEQAAVRDGAPR